MDTLTARDIVLATAEDIGADWGSGDFDYCIGYAEPGYGATDTLVVFANWNTEQLAPLADVIEATDGAELEWSDEWTRCGNCYRAMRTSPDSYMWKMFGAWSDNACEYICGDCLREDMDSALDDGYIGNPDNAVTWASPADMTAAGWTQYAPSDPMEWETGWHPGQDGNPREVLDMIREDMGEDTGVVFLINGVGQFDAWWTAWTR
jgi:hypothetical protein